MLQTVRYASYTLLQIIQGLIFVRVILSYIPMARNHPLVVFVFQITEPLLEPVRRLIHRIPSTRKMMVDFSSLIVFFIIEVLKNLIY